MKIYTYLCLKYSHSFCQYNIYRSFMLVLEVKEIYMKKLIFTVHFCLSV